MNALQIFWYHTKGQSLCYSDTNSSWWATPLPSEICAQSDPSFFEKRRLRQISAYNVSTVRNSENSQWWRIQSRLQAFQRAIDEVRTFPLSPERVAQKAIFCFWEFLSESQLLPPFTRDFLRISSRWHSEHWAHTVTTLVTTAEWRHVCNTVRTYCNCTVNFSDVGTAHGSRTVSLR